MAKKKDRKSGAGDAPARRLSGVIFFIRNIFDMFRKKRAEIKARRSQIVLEELEGEKMLSFFHRDIFKFSFFRKRRRRIYLLSVLTTFFFGLIIVFLLTASITYAYFSKDMSDPDTLINRNNTGTTIYAKEGEVLYETFGAKYRKLLQPEQFPDKMREAVIATEDKDFYKHRGVSTRGMVRALVVNMKAGEVKEGGSSITQQLVKNALLNPKRSFIRKYQEIMLALEIERQYSKDDILKMYLNEIYFGEGAWGIEDAAKVYFNKEAKDLDLAETSTLAGLPRSPSLYSPILNPEKAKERQKFVLESMVKQGFVTSEEADAALLEKLTLHGQKTEIKAPHFTMYVLDQIRETYGEDMLEKGGLRIYTTLDMKKQGIAEEALKKNMQKLKKQKASNGSLVSIDPKNGDVLAMVGSNDWENTDWGKVNISLTNQQPGSSFKPFAYISAMKKGWTTTTKIKDEPVTFPGNPPYKPRNYDGKFHGEVTLRKALANSLNIPAIKALQHAGIDETVDFAKEAGITTLDDHKRFGLSIVLGGADVKLLEMTEAYGTLANGGVYKKPRVITKVQDKRGFDITERKKEEGRRIVDEAYAFIMSDILSDNNARTETFGPNSALKLSRPAAAKTGTTEDNRDAWTMGYTPNLVTGVWVGNNDNAPMGKIAGATGAAPIWHDYMEKSLSDMPREEFQKPSNVVEKWVWTNGRVANANTKGASREYYVVGTEPKGPVLESPSEKKAAPPKQEKKKEEPAPAPAPTPKPETTPPPPAPKPEVVPPPEPVIVPPPSNTGPPPEEIKPSPKPIKDR